MQYIASIVVSLCLMSCTTFKVQKPKLNIAPDVCTQEEVVIAFVEVKTANDIVLNAKKSMIYIESLQQSIKNQQQCFQDVIAVLNG